MPRGYRGVPSTRHLARADPPLILLGRAVSSRAAPQQQQGAAMSTARKAWHGSAAGAVAGRFLPLEIKGNEMCSGMTSLGTHSSPQSRVMAITVPLNSLSHDDGYSSPSLPPIRLPRPPPPFPRVRLNEPPNLT